MKGPTSYPCRVPRRTRGDIFRAAMSPSIWWKWLQNKMLVVVRPTKIAAVASSGPRLAYSISLADPACAQHELSQHASHATVHRLTGASRTCMPPPQDLGGQHADVGANLIMTKQQAQP